MKHQLHRLPIIFAVILQAALAAGAAPYFPPRGDAWETRAPEAAGMDAALLQAAIDHAIASESSGSRDLAEQHKVGFGLEAHGEAVGPFTVRGEPTGIILRGGYIVVEWGEPFRVDTTYSVSKSLLSSVVGVAWDRGLIPSIDAPVTKLVPIPEFSSTHNSTVTWDHLLRQTSDWEGTLWGKPDWADRPPRSTPIEEHKARARHASGTVYKYNDVRVNVLALAALHVWREPLPAVARREIMDPIGASPTWRWHGYENSWIEIDGLRINSVSGGAHWGGGVMISARDLARFGLMTLHRGNWNGTQVLSEAWVAQALTPTDVEPGYGFMNWFFNTDRKMYPAAPETAFAHRGAGSNIIYVDPEHDIVAVVRWIDNAAMPAFVEKLLGAVKE